MKLTIDLRRVLRYATMLVTVAGLVYWFSRPQLSPLPPARSLSPNQLDPDRQLVLLRVDSLALLLNALQQQQPDVFTWSGADTGSKLRVEARGDLKQFELLFLAGSALPTFAKLQSNPIRPNADGRGFSVSIEIKKDVRLVRLPAHMIQSLQLNVQNASL